MAVGILLGAFGAHALKGTLSEAAQSVFDVGVRYQLIHGLALLAVGVFLNERSHPRIHLAGKLFLAGIVLFSGSLYLLTLLRIPQLGMITPLGGLAFIAGWVVLGSAFLDDSGR